MTMSNDIKLTNIRTARMRLQDFTSCPGLNPSFQFAQTQLPAIAGGQ